MTPLSAPPSPRSPARRTGDLLRAADPGGARTRTTVRSLVAGGLAAGAGWLVLTLLGTSTLPAALAGLLALLGVITLPPGATSRWATTITLATWAAAAVATLVGDGPVGLVLVVVTCVVAAAGARWGAVGRVAGFLAFLVHVLSLRLGLGSGELAAAVVALGLVAPAVLLTVRVLLPHRSVPTARRLAGDLYAQVSLVADAADRLLLEGPGGRRQRRLRLRLVAAQEIALLLDDALDGVVDEDRELLRRTVLDVEALCDHLAWAVLVVPPATGARDRRRLADQLRTARSPSTGTATAGDPLVPALLGGTDPLDEVVARLATAAERLRVVGRLPSAVAAPVRPPPDAPDDGVGALTVRVGAAAALAMLGGLLVDPGEWHWAVIGAYVVVTTTASRGAGLRKALDRALGTVVGVALGLAAAAVLQGTAVLVAFAVAVAGFVQVFRRSYALFMVALTIAVALLYELTGQLSVEVLALRLAETVVGAAAAALVVWVVLPVPTGRTVDGAVDGLLAALEHALRVVAEGDPVGPAEVRAVDHAVSALRAVTEPVAAGTVVGLGRDVRAARLLATALRVRTGALATAVGTAGTAGATSRAEAVAVVRSRVAALRGHLAGRPVPPAVAAREVPDGDDAVTVVLRAIDDRCVGYGTARGARLRHDPGALAAGSPSARD